MSFPSGLLVVAPATALWLATGGALSVPAALVALGILLSITMACLLAGWVRTPKEARHDRASRK